MLARSLARSLTDVLLLLRTDAEDGSPESWRGRRGKEGEGAGGAKKRGTYSSTGGRDTYLFLRKKRRAGFHGRPASEKTKKKVFKRRRLFLHSENPVTENETGHVREGNARRKKNSADAPAAAPSPPSPDHPTNFNSL